MDILSKKLDNMLTTPGYTPHPLCKDPLITHLSFADDILVFFDGSESSLRVIMEVFNDFAAVSGLNLSYSKTTLILDGNQPQQTLSLASLFDLQQGSLPAKYLGVPLTSQKLRPQDYQPLIDKVTNRLSFWANRKLSFAGRLQLLSSVIWSLVNFWCSIFLLPKPCLLKIERLCNAYLWKGSLGSAKGAKVSWTSVCQPKSCGGLGLRRFEDWNIIFGLKLIWLLFARSGSLWVSWIHAHLIQHRVFWELHPDRRGSWIWRKLCKLKALACPFIQGSIGNGRLLRFWHDNWCSLSPLLETIGPRGPIISGIPFAASVLDATRDGSRISSRSCNPLLTCLRAALPPVPTFSVNDDTFHWGLASDTNSSTDSGFVASQVWDSLHPQGNPVPWCNSVWFSGGLPKHKFTTWVCTLNRLPTRDRLSSWGLTTPLSCLLCNLVDENRAHLFFHCSYSSSIWSFFMDAIGQAPPASFMDILQWLNSTAIPPKLKVITKLIFQACIYEVWKERNIRLHRAESRSHTAVVKDISQTLWNRLGFLSRRSPTTASDSLILTWIRHFQINALRP